MLSWALNVSCVSEWAEKRALSQALVAFLYWSFPLQRFLSLNKIWLLTACMTPFCSLPYCCISSSFMSSGYCSTRPAHAAFLRWKSWMRLSPIPLRSSLSVKGYFYVCFCCCCLFRCFVFFFCPASGFTLILYLHMLVLGIPTETASFLKGIK